MIFQGRGIYNMSNGIGKKEWFGLLLGELVHGCITLWSLLNPDELLCWIFVVSLINLLGSDFDYQWRFGTWKKMALWLLPFFNVCKWWFISLNRIFSIMGWYLLLINCIFSLCLVLVFLHAWYHWVISIIVWGRILVGK